jgi:hypothetical protein
MSDITLTIVRHRGKALPLGRNVAVKLLLEKSSEKTNRQRALSTIRDFLVRSFPRARTI